MEKWNRASCLWTCGGVTADEASRIQQTCFGGVLNELDRCRSGPNKLPWFIGLRGERYGWVQPKYDPSSVFLKPEFYEVYHAFLRCQPTSSERIFNRHAFIYFRDPSFKKNCPETLPLELKPDCNTIAP
eukprot:g73540.t1